MYEHSSSSPSEPRSDVDDDENANNDDNVNKPSRFQSAKPAPHESTPNDGDEAPTSPVTQGFSAHTTTQSLDQQEHRTMAGKQQTTAAGSAKVSGRRTNNSLSSLTENIFIPPIVPTLPDSLGQSDGRKNASTASSAQHDSSSTNAKSGNSCTSSTGNSKAATKASKQQASITTALPASHNSIATASKDLNGTPEKSTSKKKKAKDKSKDV